jgi:hypothetical protein
MLAVQMYLQDRKRYRLVNEQAQEIFDKWARGCGVNDPQVRRVAILESLYHLVELNCRKSESEELEDKALEDKLEKKLEDYLDSFSNPLHQLQLRDALTRDQELNELISWQVGPKTISVLVSIIDRRL